LTGSRAKFGALGEYFGAFSIFDCNDAQHFLNENLPTGTQLLAAKAGLSLPPGIKEV